MMYSGKRTARRYGNEDYGREYRLGNVAVFDRSLEADLADQNGSHYATHSSHDDGYGRRDYRGPHTVEKRRLPRQKAFR